MSKLIPQNAQYSLEVYLHPFIVSCGSFWQHSTYQRVSVMYTFLRFHWWNLSLMEQIWVMTIIVACEGQLTPVGVTVFNILSAFLLWSFSISGPDACLQQKLNKQGFAGTRAARCHEIKLDEGIDYQKMCCQEFLIMECFYILCSPR